MNDRLKATAYLTAFVGLLALELWVFKRRQDPILMTLGFVALATLAALFLKNFKHLNPAIKKSQTSLAASFPLVLNVTIICILGLLLLGAWTDNLEFHFEIPSSDRLDRKILKFVFLKIPGVVGQQLALYYIIYPLCLILSGSAAAAVGLTSFLFALAHFPNPVLTVATLLVAPLWQFLYFRYHRLFPLVVSHFLLAGFLYWFFPSDLHLNFKVGAKAWDELKIYSLLKQEGLWPQVKDLGSKTYYERQGGTREAYVHALYRDILSRPASAAETQDWVKGMECTSRREVVIKFFAGAEYQSRVKR